MLVTLETHKLTNICSKMEVKDTTSTTKVVAIPLLSVCEVSDMSDTGNKEQNRMPKNLRVLESTADALEEMAKSRYGSKMKQGQVVDDLVAMYGDETMLGLIEDIHEATVGGSARSGSASTHTSKSDSASTKSRDGPVGELEDLASDGEAIDPEEHDLSVLKGVRGVDRAGIVVAALKGTGSSCWPKGEITDFVQRNLKMSRNGARNVAHEATFQLIESPLMGMDSWVREQIPRDIDDGLNNAREGGEGMSDWKYEDTYGGSLTEYTVVDNDRFPGCDVYYIDESAMLLDMRVAMELLVVPIRGGVRKIQQKRSKNALCEIGARLVEYESSTDVEPDESPVRMLSDRVETVIEKEQMMEWAGEEVLAVVSK